MPYFLLITPRVVFLNPNWFSNNQKYSRLIYRYKDVVFIKDVYVTSPRPHSLVSSLSHSRNMKTMQTYFKSCEVY